MEIHNIKTLEDEVNRKNSKLWLRMNDNSKAKFFRDNFVKENGGFFKQNGKHWYWVSQREVNNGYWLKRVDTDEKVFFENMSEFGAQNGLTAVKICELLNGKRKTYKGWTAVELRPVKETSGQHIKEKKIVKKVKTYNGATFQNIATKEIFYIENIAEYARQHNINKSNLYKVSIGKMKSYKGLKLYNPMDS